MQQSIVKFT